MTHGVADARGRTARGVWQRSYVRVMRGEAQFMPLARAWSADDYDLIEKLADLGLPCSEIRRYFSPMPTANAMRCVMARAGIQNGKGRGRPSKDDHAKWAAIHAQWKTGEL